MREDGRQGQECPALTQVGILLRSSTSVGLFSSPLPPSPPSPPSPHPSRLYSVYIPTVVRPHSLHSTDATERFHWQIAFSRWFLNAPVAFYIRDSTIYSLLMHEWHVHREPFMPTFSSYKVTQTGKVRLCQQKRFVEMAYAASPLTHRGSFFHVWLLVSDTPTPGPCLKPNFCQTTLYGHCLRMCKSKASLRLKLWVLELECEKAAFHNWRCNPDARKFISYIVGLWLLL